jgi:hypothetical protein
VDQLCPVQTIDRLCQRVVVAIALAADSGNGNAWVSLLTHQMTRTSPEFLAMVVRGYGNLSNAEKLNYGRTKGIVYGMAVMHDADKLHLPYRQYIWQGGTYAADLTDAAGNPDPRAGQAWCFGYGESEWLSGTTYAQARQNASDTNADGGHQTPIGRVNCN